MMIKIELKFNLARLFSVLLRNIISNYYTFLKFGANTEQRN